MKWPNFFVPGAPKSGTTSLASYLSDHPDVFMSPMKEPHYFSRIRPSSRLSAFYPHISSEDRYLSLFSKSGTARIVGEASSSYFWDPEAPCRISEVCPDARFIVLLRDPVERAFSHYLNDVREGFEKRSFEQAIVEELESGARPRRWGAESVYLTCGFYGPSLERYFALFGEKRVKVMVFDEFVADTHATLRAACSFLEIDEAAVEKMSLHPHNVFAVPRGKGARWLLATPFARRLGRLWPRSVRAKVRRQLLKPAAKPEMPSEIRERLQHLFREDSLRSADLLGRRLPWQT